MYLRRSFTKILYPGQIQLQGMGWVNAKPASDFKVGEWRMYNTGSCSQITKIVPKGKNSLIFTTVWRGKEYESVVRKNTLLAIGDERNAE